METPVATTLTIIVCGSRDMMYHKDPFYREQIFSALDMYHKICPIQFLAEGGQTGIDTAAREWAQKNGVPGKSFFADWTQYGRSAGPIRNKKMLTEIQPNLVVAFPGGIGTASMKALARSIKCPVVEINLENDRSVQVVNIPENTFNLADYEIVEEREEKTA